MELAAVKGFRNDGMAIYGNDSGNLVEFVDDVKIENPYKSKEAGHPVYEFPVLVRIQPFGQNRSVTYLKFVKGEHDVQYPAQYAAFLEGRKDVHEGTPIQEWPPITREQALHFKTIGIHTVEALASVSDTNLGQFLGAREMREKAKVWLDNAKGGAIAAKLQADLDVAHQDIEALKLQIKEIQSEQLKKEKGK